MAELQGQNTLPLEAALRACHIPLDRIPQDVIQQTMRILPGYARTHNLAYGIVHELENPL
jgi:hypothetical protein